MADIKPKGDVHADRDLRAPNDAEQGTAAGGEPTAERPASGLLARARESLAFAEDLQRKDCPTLAFDQLAHAVRKVCDAVEAASAASDFIVARCTRCTRLCLDFHQRGKDERVCILCVSDELDEARMSEAFATAVSDLLYEFDCNPPDGQCLETRVAWLRQQLDIARQHRDAVRCLSTPTTPPAQQHGKGEHAAAEPAAQEGTPAQDTAVSEPSDRYSPLDSTFAQHSDHEAARIVYGAYVAARKAVRELLYQLPNTRLLRAISEPIDPGSPAATAIQQACGLEDSALAMLELRGARLIQEVCRAK